VESAYVSSCDDSREVSARVARGGFTILVTRGLEGILAVVFTIVVARLIGPEGFGVVGIAFSLIAIFQIVARFGVPEAIARFVPKYFVQKRWGMVMSVLRESFKYILVLALVFSAGLAMFAGTIATSIYHDPSLTTLFRAAAFVLFSSLLLGGFQGTFQGFQKMKYILLTQVSYQVFRIVGAVVFIALGLFATGALLGMAASYAIACGISLFFLLPRLLPRGRSRRAEKEKGLSREIFLFSAPLWLGGIGAILMLYLAPLILGHVVSIEKVGYYTAAFAISLYAADFPGSLGMALFPAVSERWTLGDKRGCSAAIGATLKLISIVLIPLVVAGIFFSGFIISLLYGAEFVAGANVLRVLLAAFLLYSLAGVNISILNGIGCSGVGAKAWWSGAGVGVVAITILAWTHGAIGAAVGLGLGMGISAIFGAYFFVRLTGVKYPFHVFWRPLLASGAMLLFLLPMKWVVRSVPLAVLAGIVGLLIYLYAFLKLGGIGTEDIKVMRELSSSMGRPRVLEQAIRFLKRYV
jgi:stage V sporulation protein B